MDYYGSISKGYNELYKDEQLNKLTIIRNNIKLNKTAKMLDVGCGTGISSQFDCFDYVISITAIHNFANIKKSIDEMKRVGRKMFVFSVLKKSKKANAIKSLIAKSFKIGKIIEEGKDAIFFCQKSKIFDHARK